MKKFLVLSFLMVMSAGVASFAQNSIETSRYTTDGVERLYAGFEPSVTAGVLKAMITSIDAPLPPGVGISYVDVLVIYDDFYDYTYNNELYSSQNNGTGFVSLYIPINSHFYDRITYRWHVTYTNGHEEGYELIENYTRP